MGCCGSDPAAATNNVAPMTIKKNINDIGTKPVVIEVSRKQLYKKNPKIKLGYWKMRGVAHQIRYLLEFIEHPYEEDLYVMGDAPNFSTE
jgi:hypothetical protein